MKHLLLVLFSLHFSIHLLAQGRSGPEWTFTNSELINLGRIKDINSLPQASEGHDNYQRKLLSKWKHEIKKACSFCKIKVFGSLFSIDKIRVQISKEVWFEISRDPWVLEVTASPMNLNTFETHSEFFQRVIWDTAHKIGLSPHSRIGGGHIHLEIKTYFGQDKVLFRNFIVDLINHPELFLGGLGFDLLNAPPLSILSGAQNKAFTKIIYEFDQGKMSIQELINKINKEVYTQTFYDPYPHQQHNPDKYQALNLLHLETLEIRGINPQATAQNYLLLLKLFESRINYLKKHSGLIPINFKDYSSFVNSYSVRKMDFHTSLIDPNIILSKVRSYIEDSGLNWSDFATLINSNLSTVESGTNSCKKAVSL